MIEQDGKEYYTEAQWAKKKRAVLKCQRSKGIHKEWYISKKETASADFYSEDQTRPYNQQELAKLKREQKVAREARKKKQEGERLRKIEAENNREQTAWQWLVYEHRVPFDAAEPTLECPKWWDSYDCEWHASERVWNYYKKKDTYIVEDGIYRALKSLYISKFGGWESIDLEHTTYDGRTWW